MMMSQAEQDRERVGARNGMGEEEGFNQEEQNNNVHVAKL